MKKKLTDLVVVTAETRDKIVEGILVSDRVGEAKFVNFDRFEAEGIREQPDPNGLVKEGEEENDDEHASTLFG